MLALQRSAGNAAVAAMLADSRPGRPALGGVLARETLTKAPRETRQEKVEGVVWHNPKGTEEDGWNLRVGRSPGSKLIRRLAHGERIFVVDRHSGGRTWSRVTTAAGETGFLAEVVVKTDSPCPGAWIKTFKADEFLEPLVDRHFSDHYRDGRDRRFYANVIQWINDGEIKPYKKVRYNTDRSIWIPTPGFANSVYGRVPSGSRSGGLWAKTKRAVKTVVGAAKRVANTVIDIHIGAAAFVYGLLRGVVKEITELVAGVAGAVKGIVTIVKSLVSGDIIGDVTSLWSAFKGLRMTAVLRTLWDDFVSQWNSKNPWTRWAYRGEIVGRVVAMAVIAYFTAGASLLATAGVKALGVIKKVSHLPGVRRILDRLGKGKDRGLNSTLRAADEKTRKRKGNRLKQWPTPDGRHTVKIRTDGRVMICSDCKEIRHFYAEELAARPALADRLDRALSRDRDDPKRDEEIGRAVVALDKERRAKPKDKDDDEDDDGPKATMRFQVQWDTSGANVTFSTVKVASAKRGVSVAQAVAGLESAWAKVKPATAKRASQTAKNAQIRWIRGRPPHGVPVGAWSKDFTYRGFADARVDIESKRGRNLRH